MLEAKIKPVMSDSLSGLGLTSDILLFALNYDFTPPDKKKSIFQRLKENQGGIDLDLSCVLYDDACLIQDIVWFKELRDKAEAVRHQGDSLTGKDRGFEAMYHAPLDQEQIRIYLSKLPANISKIALIASSYFGQDFNQVNAGEIHLSDDEGNRAFTLDLKTLAKGCKMIWVAQLEKQIDDWQLTMQNLTLTNKDIPEAAQFVGRELTRALVVPSSQL